MAIITTDITNVLSTQATSGGTISGGSGEYLPLVDRILKNKFQLYNRSRQKLSGECRTLTGLKPLQMFIDSKQGDKKFVVGSFQYKPTSNSIIVDFYEYDNSTNINLVG